MPIWGWLYKHAPFYHFCIQNSDSYVRKSGLPLTRMKKHIWKINHFSFYIFHIIDLETQRVQVTNRSWLHSRPCVKLLLIWISIDACGFFLRWWRQSWVLCCSSQSTVEYVMGVENSLISSSISGYTCNVCRAYNDD